MVGLVASPYQSLSIHQKLSEIEDSGRSGRPTQVYANRSDSLFSILLTIHTKNRTNGKNAKKDSIRSINFILRLDTHRYLCIDNKSLVQ